MDPNGDLVRERIRDSISLKQQILADDALIGAILEAADAMALALGKGGRILFCGNGGSAADAQHFAAELSGRFLLERAPLDAETLHGNASYLTAVANDYGYAEVYARLLRARGRPGDLLFGISTSGKSANVVRAFEAARSVGMSTIGLTGAEGGALAGLSDVLIAVPSRLTPRIQEAHLLIGHVVCELVESACSESAPNK